MRFANIYISNNGVKNIGSNLQIMAIDYLYKYMGINRAEIIRIEYSKLHEYDGETCILPVNYYIQSFFKYGEENMFSPSIIPVFIGVSFFQDVFSSKEIQFLKNCEPIGCRDEYTYQNLKRYGVDCYLAGCITATLPRRRQEGKYDKIFCVDMKLPIVGFVKENCGGEIERCTHYYEKEDGNLQRFAEGIYQKYIEEARLVITSRLHCAVPCAAAGIPVIMITPKRLHTMTWLDNLVPIYNENELEKINWNPEVVNYEMIKNKMLITAKRRLLFLENANEYRDDISCFFLNHSFENEYIIPVITETKEWIDSRFQNSPPAQYALWGLTSIAIMINGYIQKNYPQTKLTTIYDRDGSKAEKKYNGILLQSAESIKPEDNIFIFVTAYSATQEAKILFDKIKLPKERYYLCCTSDSV